jgi:hypothetical protein
MNYEYDLFEKFPDGSSLWRSCVLGRKNVSVLLQELAKESKHQFYAINLRTAKVISLRPSHGADPFRMPGKMQRPRKQEIA